MNIKNRILIISFTLITNLACGQKRPSQAYYDFIKKADSLYKAKDYKCSAFTYSSAFKTNGWKGLINDRYNAACSWALANYPDSSFFQLNRVATKGNYTNYDHISTDPDFKFLT